MLFATIIDIKTISPTIVIVHQLPPVFCHPSWLLTLKTGIWLPGFHINMLKVLCITGSGDTSENVKKNIKKSCPFTQSVVVTISIPIHSLLRDIRSCSLTQITPFPFPTISFLTPYPFAYPINSLQLSQSSIQTVPFF